MGVISSSIGSAAGVYCLVAITGYLTFGNDIAANIVGQCKLFIDPIVFHDSTLTRYRPGVYCFHYCKSRDRGFSHVFCPLASSSLSRFGGCSLEMATKCGLRCHPIELAWSWAPATCRRTI